MRVKLDENLPERLAGALLELGHDVDTVIQEGLQGQEDEELWPKVQAASRLLVTKDLGFCDERRYPPGTHHGILVLRLSDDRSETAAGRRLQGGAGRDLGPLPRSGDRSQGASAATETPGHIARRGPAPFMPTASVRQPKSTGPTVTP